MLDGETLIKNVGPDECRLLATQKDCAKSDKIWTAYTNDLTDTIKRFEDPGGRAEIYLKQHHQSDTTLGKVAGELFLCP